MRYVFYQAGHKVARTVTNREDFLALRNSADNLSNLALARMGNAEAKARLVQFAYNDLMPDGKVAGCCHPSDHFFHDIDCYDAAQAAEAKERILSMKDAIGLRMLEQSVSGGWHLVCQRERGKTILENQVRIASILKLEMDTNCHDLGRVVYSTSGSEEDLVYLDDRLFEESMTVEESAEEYELLKVRAREGREEVPESAKHDQKHYRPWEDSAAGVLPLSRGSQRGSEQADLKAGHEADQTTPNPSYSGGESSAQGKASFPMAYHGHSFETIIHKYWELNNHGFEPTVGDRDAKTYELAYALRHICGNNFDWLDQVIPCYDGFPLEEKRAKIRSALKSTYEGMPRSLTVVLDALEGKADSKDDSKDNAPKPNDFYFNAPQPPELCKHLPKLIRLLTSKVPGPYKAAVASSVFPSLGAHLYQTTFKYTDNVEHEATLMDCLVAESGTGKGCIDKPIDHIMADIRERDAIHEKREAEWKEEMNTKSANKDQSKRPEGLIIQEIHGDMTNAALVTRTDEAEGHFLYVKVNEIQMFDALKGNGKAGHQYLVMCLSFDPNNRYGQTRIGTQSVTKTVCLRMNWNACTTPKKVKKYFKSVCTDGPVQRISFSTIPQREIGADQLVFGDYDAMFDAELKPYILNLCASRGLIDCPQATKLAKKLQKECQELAVLSQSRVFDDLSHRACVIAWLKACVLYVANGCKWEKSIEEFTRWSLQNDLWCKMNFFGAMIAADAEDTCYETKRGPQNMLVMLPDEFTMDDVLRVRQQCGLSLKGAGEQTRQWSSRGYVTVVTDNSFRKLKYKTAV